MQAREQELERSQHRFAIEGTGEQSQRDEKNAGSLPVVSISEDTEPLV